MSDVGAGPRHAGTPLYWVLRIVETALLATSLIGIGMFAWSLVDIVRIETTTSLAGSLPSGAWPGILVFFGSMVLLQVVRVFLHRYRRADGTPRADSRSAVADVTAEALGGETRRSGDARGPE